MKIAVVNPPLIGHKTRGIGIYTEKLLQALIRIKDISVLSADITDLPTDVDLFHFPYFDPFFMTLPFRIKKPFVVTVHDLITLKFPDKFPRGIKGEIKWQLQKMNLKRAKAIITDSYTSKKDISDIAKFPEEKIFPIYLAANEIFYNRISDQEKIHIRQKYHLPEKFVLFIGEINWNKNLPNIIKACTLSKTSLVIVSKHFFQPTGINPWTFSLRESQLLVTNNQYVTVIDYLTENELTGIYQLATALIYASYYEGFGLPILEAFASNCPVITCNRGSMKEVARDAAIFVNPNDVSDISRNINILLRNKNKRKLYQAKGWNRVHDFSWDKTAHQTYQVYQQVLENEIR